NSVTNEVEKLANQGYPAVVLTSPAVRLYFRKLIERSVQGLTIVSHAEIDQSVEIQIIGVIKL
ncbi:MAG: FHIPEP family type III secretion protein, partial [Selenomonadaceae bacterium]|nr:FHIPEP family type III secretion protein [Selenomonadaceae bacterium]